MELKGNGTELMFDTLEEQTTIKGVRRSTRRKNSKLFIIFQLISHHFMAHMRPLNYTSNELKFER